jgi:23S rRNA (adenine2503-C2)-methyltransferase
MVENDTKKHLFGPLRAMNLKEMTAFLQREREPSFRGRQVFKWVYEKGVRSFSEMTNLSKELRQHLEEKAFLGGLREVETSGDSTETQKITFRTDDNEFIECVLMRDDFMDEINDEEEEQKGSTVPQKKVSVCVSSQIGCALRCTFCMTGYGGFRRNLRVDEIIDQVLVTREKVQNNERIGNIVFMGMGEPLLNLEALIPSLRLLTDPQGMQFSTRRITVSTAGVIQGLEDFARADTGVNLAVSLNATTQKTRDRIMPGCKSWPLKDVLDACRRFPLTKRRRITFEYVLLKGVNDTRADVKRLKEMLRDLPCKINLIVYNPSDELRFEATGEKEAEAFRDDLLAAHYTVSLRRSKGRRYNAACGQLAGHLRRKDKTCPI